MKDRTALYGLAGFPLAHSFSARYFAAKFRAEGISAEYRNFEIPSVSLLPGIIESTPALRGLNITIPYKRQALPLLDEIDSAARSIGAVNVVCIVRGRAGKPRLIGRNTDVTGFCDSLRPLLGKARAKALVLGTGGAAQAVSCGLRMMGVTPQHVSRTAGNGALSYGDLTARIMEEHKLIVNCTPLGMAPRTDTCPPIPYRFLTAGHLLYDLVYNPGETLFLRLGKERGAAVKNGYEMLCMQAEASWKLWNALSSPL